MENDNKKVVTRFAPSPTGFMHVGGIRTALYAWLFAKQKKGKFILRIEDTDKEREVSGAIEHIQESLKWLGLSSDEFYIQSERLEIYKKYAQKLIDKDLAYADPYTEEVLENFRKKAEEEKRPFLFRDYRPEKFEKWDGTKALRFKVEKIKRYAWNDLVWGELSAGEEALDDFIIIKSDGYPTYNFAHIVDDIEMNVTHVMRGQEFISSTPKFLSLYDALGIPAPYFATLPPILGFDGHKKLSKRDGAKDILDYKKEGYLPDAMINFLAFLGWNPGDDREVLTREELIASFEIEKIQRSGARLSDDKLNWINKEHIKLMPPQAKKNEVIKKLASNKDLSGHFTGRSGYDLTHFLDRLSGTVLEHISKWGDIDTLVEEGEIQYFFEPPVYDESLLSWKGKSPVSEAKEHLTWIHEKLTLSPDNLFDSVDSIKSLIFDYATEKGRGEVLWPLRVSLCGKEKSPDPFTLIYILGKDESLKRIMNAIKN
jgi:glutamyl-tRNA synthetase